MDADLSPHIAEVEYDASHRWNVYFGRRRLGTVMAMDRNRAIRKAIKTFAILLPDRRRVDVQEHAPGEERASPFELYGERLPGLAVERLTEALDQKRRYMDLPGMRLHRGP